jgi:hypothetical protein
MIADKNAVLSGLASLALVMAFTPTMVAQTFNWQVVVNNGVTVPGDSRKFNSYNQPSVNANRLVVFRGRSKGGTSGEPAHGVYTRDMAVGGSLLKSFDRNTLVPQPNNLLMNFVEPPSFPRIDMFSKTIASRGNHPPVWRYMLADGTESRAGTTGIYTDPFGYLIAGDSNLGAVPGFGFFSAPNAGPNLNGIKFDVFPGAPAVTDGSTIVFKGNYTVSNQGGLGVPNQGGSGGTNQAGSGGTISKTGVYYRDLTNAAIPLSGGGVLAPAGGVQPTVLIANSDSLIPGTATPFGSTAPPSAAGRIAVFAGFDNEDNPTKGGIYSAPLTGPKPALTALVKIGGAVPGESGAVFNKLGEGLSFDGRYVAFWGAWGTTTKALTLQCPTDGNKDLLAFCLSQYPHGFQTTVPVHQGIFVHNTVSGITYVVAKTPTDFGDFVYWNFSGLVPGTGESDEAGEPARWRSASFAAVSGLVSGSRRDTNFYTAFKARKGTVTNGAYVSPVDGIYLRKGPGTLPIVTVVKTGMDGALIDPAAIDPLTQGHLPVTEMGIERDGFRGKWLTLTVSMGTEEAGWGGIYLTGVPVQ